MPASDALVTPDGDDAIQDLVRSRQAVDPARLADPNAPLEVAATTGWRSS